MTPNSMLDPRYARQVWSTFRARRPGTNCRLMRRPAGAAVDEGLPSEAPVPPALTGGPSETTESPTPRQTQQESEAVMIKLNAGISRKVGEPNFGSRGASVNVELELESSAAQNTDVLHQKIRGLFAIAKSAVDEELGLAAHRTAPGQPATAPPSDANGRNKPPPSGRRWAAQRRHQRQGPAGQRGPVAGHPGHLRAAGTRSRGASPPAVWPSARRAVPAGSVRVDRPSQGPFAQRPVSRGLLRPSQVPRSGPRGAHRAAVGGPLTPAPPPCPGTKGTGSVNHFTLFSKRGGHLRARPTREGPQPGWPGAGVSDQGRHADRYEAAGWRAA